MACPAAYSSALPPSRGSRPERRTPSATSSQNPSTPTVVLTASLPLWAVKESRCALRQPSLSLLCRQGQPRGPGVSAIVKNVGWASLSHCPHSGRAREGTGPYGEMHRQAELRTLVSPKQLGQNKGGGAEIVRPGKTLSNSPAPARAVGAQQERPAVKRSWTRAGAERVL